jgi:hypothetical protein
MAETPIVGIAEVAEMAGLSRANVRMMRSRGLLPEPQVVLAMGPVWKRSVIERWVKKRAKA